MKVGNSLTADDRGVSPVIGVILMVAITVILAAVIGTFVLGLGDSIGGSATAGITVEGEGTGNATVTLTSNGTADRVFVRGDGINSPQNLTQVGDTVAVNGTGSASVIATSDGEETLIRSFEIN